MLNIPSHLKDFQEYIPSAFKTSLLYEKKNRIFWLQSIFVEGNILLFFLYQRHNKVYHAHNFTDLLAKI